MYQSRLSVSSLDFSDREQLSLLKDMGIVIQAMSDGRVQISHTMQLVTLSLSLSSSPSLFPPLHLICEQIESPPVV